MKFVLGQNLDAMALALGPMQEGSLIGRPAGERVVFGEAVEERPFDAVVARRPRRPWPQRVDRARRIGWQPHLSPRPGAHGREQRRSPARRAGVDAEIVVGATPVVIGRPGRGGGDQGDRSCPRGAVHDDQMMAQRPAVRCRCIQDLDQIAAGGQIRRDGPALKQRPVAAGFIGTLRRRVESGGARLSFGHDRRDGAVAQDAQPDRGDGRRQEQIDPVARMIAAPVGITPGGRRAGRIGPLHP